MNFKTLIALMIGFSFLVVPVAFSAENQVVEDVDGVRDHGVVWNIAKDRKIEKVGGIYNPEGIDRYVERKINEMSNHIAQMEQKLDTTMKKLDEVLAKQSAAMTSAAPEKVKSAS